MVKKKTDTVWLPVKPDEKEKKNFKIGANTTMAVGWLLTGLALFLSAKSLVNTEKWKRSEFVSSRFAEFSQAPSVKFFNKMLDYEVRNFAFPDSPLYVITREEVAQALTTSRFHSRDNIDIRIRDYADDYLDRLGQFYRHYRAGLIKADEIDYYLGYYLKKVSDNISNNTPNARGAKALADSLRNFIQAYSFDDAQALFCLEGYNIISSDSCRCKKNSNYWKDSIANLTWYEKIFP